MSETKFTPGPWVFDKYLNLNANGRPLMVTGVSIPCGHSKEETDANMNLIAAAPEMYEMLEDFKDFAISQGWKRSIVTAAEEILAKARGESC